jgi:hypothetical protein
MSFKSRAFAFALRHSARAAGIRWRGMPAFSLASAARRLEREREREVHEADEAERRTRKGLDND